MPTRISDEARAAIAESLRKGGTLAAIAREHGVSATFVRTIARDAGIVGSATRTAQTQKAREAVLADLAKRRGVLAEQLIREAERLVASLHEPHVTFNFGGKDNTYAERLLPEPDVKAKQTILVSVGIALDKSKMLLAQDSGASADGAASLLGSLGTALAEQFGDGAAHRKGEE